VQGTIGGRDFLISCPIPLYSRARVRLEPGWTGEPPAVAVHHTILTPGGPQPIPGPGTKALRALEVTLLALGGRVRRAVIHLETPGLPGKGLGTSTADILAVAGATAAALGEQFRPEQLARIALAIEPSDSTMFPGLALLDHRRGSMLKVLQPPPPLGLIILDLGGEVDTEQFNRRPDLGALNRQKEPLVREALRLVHRGIKCGDPVLVGRGATISTLAHQVILPHPGLPELVREACRRGALGVVRAHSGTVLGVLAPLCARATDRVAEFLARWPGATVLAHTHVTGGGVKAWRTADAYGKPPASWR
jgi:L-threonine kinase